MPDLDHTNFVAAMYITVLRRSGEPDPTTGPVYWIGLMDNGTLDRDGVAYSFLHAEEPVEFIGLYGKLKLGQTVDPTDPEVERAIRHFYWSGMNTVPSQGEIDAWVSSLQSGEITYYELPVRLIEAVWNLPDNLLYFQTLWAKIQASVYFWVRFIEREIPFRSEVWYDALISVVQGVSRSTNINNAYQLIEQALTDWPRDINELTQTQYDQMASDLYQKFNF